MLRECYIGGALIDTGVKRNVKPFKRYKFEKKCLLQRDSKSVVKLSNHLWFQNGQNVLKLSRIASS